MPLSGISHRKNSRLNSPNTTLPFVCLFVRCDANFDEIGKVRLDITEFEYEVLNKKYFAINLWPTGNTVEYLVFSNGSIEVIFTDR